MTEKQLSQAIVDAAGLLGWLVYRTHDSRRSPAGFPDLVLVKPPRIVFAELKTETGRLQPDQVKWLAGLSAIAGDVADLTVGGLPAIVVALWRPSDLDRALALLRGAEAS